MHSTQETKKPLPDGKYTEEELAKIDADLRELADILFEKWLAERNAEKLKAEQVPSKP